MSDIRINGKSLADLQAEYEKADSLGLNCSDELAMIAMLREQEARIANLKHAAASGSPTRA